MIDRVLILGTGLLGASTGLALRAAELNGSAFSGSIVGWDKDPRQAADALRVGAIDSVAADPIEAARGAQLVVLATPVYAILDWMEQLAAVLAPSQVLTDVGSTKVVITEAGERLYNHAGRASFLPGHPMAGKEIGGAAEADASIFRGAAWIFTAHQRELQDEEAVAPYAAAIGIEWTRWVQAFGCRVMEMDAGRHDELVAWVSHLPQYLSTALSALLQEKVGDAPELNSIGGRALREMTRLGSSPYSMWRDVAYTNTEAVAAAILALEQRLTHLRENLRTPELREEFEMANRFRRR